MFAHLQIPYRRERVLVGMVDLGLSLVAPVWRLAGRVPGRNAPRRILLLRLERIGDLLMSGAAIAAVRAMAPEATIDLVVGSWNAEMARLIPGIDRVDTLDAPWLARGAGGTGYRAMIRQARGWRSRGYDLAINFEGDIRSHVLMALSGAARRVGFDMAGGGPLLTTRVPHDPAEHTAENAARLVEAAFERPSPAAHAFLQLTAPAAARDAAAALLPAHGRFIAVHASGGRAIKQWAIERFAAAAQRLAATHDATIVLTGSPGDREIVDRVRRGLDPSTRVVDVSGRADLLTLAALLERCDLLVTGDTGPMHLAAAFGTPVVGVFGPSQPARYAPRIQAHRIVRIDLWCAPCNLIRLPPARCRGVIPDCLAGVTVDAVCDAADAVLAEARGR